MNLRFHLANKIQCVASPRMIRIGSDERTVVVASGRRLFRIDLVDSTQAELCTLPDSASNLSLSVNHGLIAVTVGTVETLVYDLHNGALLQSMSRAGAPGSLQTAPAHRIAISPNGKTLVTTTLGSRIFVSNIETGQWEHIMFVKYDGCDVAVSPDGKYVALLGAPKASEISGHLTMFLVRRGLQPLWTRWHESENALTSGYFSPDSKSLVTCGAGDGARVWDSVSGELQWHCETQDNSRLRAAWSFEESNVIATLGDELMLVKNGNAAPVFRTAISSPESMLAVASSGRLLIRMEDKDVMAVWKLVGST